MARSRRLFRLSAALAVVVLVYTYVFPQGCYELADAVWPPSDGNRVYVLTEFVDIREPIAIRDDLGFEVVIAPETAEHEAFISLIASRTAVRSRRFERHLVLDDAPEFIVNQNSRPRFGIISGMYADIGDGWPLKIGGHLDFDGFWKGLTLRKNWVGRTPPAFPPGSNPGARVHSAAAQDAVRPPERPMHVE